jgi:hypothetical protein
VPNEGLLAQEIQCQINLLRRGAAGADVIGLVAATLVLKIAAASRTMAEAVPAPAPRTRARQGTRQARDIPAAAFARDAARSASRRARSGQAGTAHRRAGGIAPHAPADRDRAKGPATAARGPARPPWLARQAATAPARSGCRWRPAKRERERREGAAWIAASRRNRVRFPEAYRRRIESGVFSSG